MEELDLLHKKNGEILDCTEWNRLVSIINYIIEFYNHYPTKLSQFENDIIGQFIGPKGDKGEDGFSPTATVTKAGKVATITITDKNGTTTAQISDGVDGQGSDDMLKETYDANNNGIVDNAEKVNNHTVNSDVPENAVFTDTTYSEATTSTAGLMSASDKEKLDGIEEGANVNVQADWNQSVDTEFDYIKNKPNLATVATSGSYNDLSDTPPIPIQADWNQENKDKIDFIKNKPENLADKDWTYENFVSKDSESSNIDSLQKRQTSIEEILFVKNENKYLNVGDVDYIYINTTKYSTNIKGQNVITQIKEKEENGKIGLQAISEGSCIFTIDSIDDNTQYNITYTVFRKVLVNGEDNRSILVGDSNIINLDQNDANDRSKKYCVSKVVCENNNITASISGRQIVVTGQNKGISKLELSFFGNNPQKIYIEYCVGAKTEVDGDIIRNVPNPTNGHIYDNITIKGEKDVEIARVEFINNYLYEGYCKKGEEYSYIRQYSSITNAQNANYSPKEIQRISFKNGTFENSLSNDRKTISIDMCNYGGIVNIICNDGKSLTVKYNNPTIWDYIVQTETFYNETINYEYVRYIYPGEYYRICFNSEDVSVGLFNNDYPDKITLRKDQDIDNKYKNTYVINAENINDEAVQTSFYVQYKQDEKLRNFRVEVRKPPLRIEGNTNRTICLNEIAASDDVHNNYKLADYIILTTNSPQIQEIIYQIKGERFKYTENNYYKENDEGSWESLDDNSQLFYDFALIGIVGTNYYGIKVYINPTKKDDVFDVSSLITIVGEDNSTASVNYTIKNQKDFEDKMGIILPPDKYFYTELEEITPKNQMIMVVNNYIKDVNSDHTGVFETLVTKEGMVKIIPKGIGSACIKVIPSENNVNFYNPYYLFLSVIDNAKLSQLELENNENGIEDYLGILGESNREIYEGQYDFITTNLGEIIGVAVDNPDYLYGETYFVTGFRGESQRNSIYVYGKASTQKVTVTLTLKYSGIIKEVSVEYKVKSTQKEFTFERGMAICPCQETYLVPGTLGERKLNEFNGELNEEIKYIITNNNSQYVYLYVLNYYRVCGGQLDIKYPIIAVKYSDTTTKKINHIYSLSKKREVKEGYFVNTFLVWDNKQSCPCQIEVNDENSEEIGKAAVNLLTNFYDHSLNSNFKYPQDLTTQDIQNGIQASISNYELGEEENVSNNIQGYLTIS